MVVPIRGPPESTDPNRSKTQPRRLPNQANLVIPSSESVGQAQDDLDFKRMAVFGEGLTVDRNALALPTLGHWRPADSGPPAEDAPPLAPKHAYSHHYPDLGSKAATTERLTLEVV